MRGLGSPDVLVVLRKESPMALIQESSREVTREDWSVVKSLLPQGWEEQAYERGALKRCRNFRDAGVLLRALLIHLVDGCSLRETAVRLREGGLAKVSDVALLKRLRASGLWFRWICQRLLKQMNVNPAQVFPGLRIRMIDGTTVSEPGATGSIWRIHYSITLPSLRCDELFVTEQKEGETFQRFNVKPGDLLIGDRGYAHRAGIAHVVSQGGHILVRLNLGNVPLEDVDGQRIDILEKLKELHGTTLGDWPVVVRCKGGRIHGRLCAVKKSLEATLRSQKKIERDAAYEKRTLRPETVEAAGYVFVFTTLPQTVCTEKILEFYRGRWQVELAFKRLKSLLGLGHLKKTDKKAAKAWLQGKLMASLLIETLIAAGERFSPWGFSINSRKTKSVFMA